MKKLYFKKLKSGLIYAIIIFVIYVIGANILVTLSNFFKNHYLIQLLIIGGVPAVIMFAVATNRRINNDDKFKSYNRSVPYEKLKLKDDLIYTLKSTDFKCEILAALTLFGIYSILGISTINALAILSKIISCIIFTLFYAVADLVSWTVTHKRYLDERGMVVMHAETDEGNK